ncbi:MAG: hypothetical protein NVSMB48_22420 [Marmoricola sp.]
MSDEQSPMEEPPTFTAPPPTGMPYAPPAPAAAYGSGLALPPGVVLASRGRRVGAYFLSILLAIVTLGIGYVIWGLIVWGQGTSPALQVLGMRAWKPAEGKVAGWGTMALRNIVGGLVQGILGFITGLISFILFLADDEHRTIPDRIGSTIIVHDPGKTLG